MIVSKYPQSRQKNCSAKENDVALYRGGWLEGQSPLSIKPVIIYYRDGISGLSTGTYQVIVTTNAGSLSGTIIKT